LAYGLEVERIYFKKNEINESGLPFGLFYFLGPSNPATICSKVWGKYVDDIENVRRFGEIDPMYGKKDLF